MNTMQKDLNVLTVTFQAAGTRRAAVCGSCVEKCGGSLTWCRVSKQEEPQQELRW